MDKTPLTRRQREIVDFLQTYSVEHGMSPTLEEIAQHFGVNKVTIFGHVSELERKGVLKRAAKGVSRGLQLVDDPPRSNQGVTILGSIAAGAPIEAIEVPEVFEMSDFASPDKDIYGLRVRGDSMIEDAIADGDIVLVERRENAREGETVVAVLPDGDCTLKRLYHEGDQIRLQPANATLKPLFVDAADVSVRGVVVGVLRQF